jgi:hypothetical protein
VEAEVDLRPLHADLRQQSGIGTGFSQCTSVSAARICPSALQTHISFIFHLCYMILPIDIMSATNTEHCMLSNITNMIGVFRKKPCNVGVATVLTQVYPSNRKELTTEAFKDPYLLLFPHSCAQNLPLHSAVCIRNTISMTRTIKLKSRERIFTVSCNQQFFEHLFILCCGLL